MYIDKDDSKKTRQHQHQQHQRSQKQQSMQVTRSSKNQLKHNYVINCTVVESTDEIEAARYVVLVYYDDNEDLVIFTSTVAKNLDAFIDVNNHKFSYYIKCLLYNI